MELMLTLLEIIQGIISNIMTSAGFALAGTAALLPEMELVYLNKNIKELVISYNKQKGLYIKHKYYEDSNVASITDDDIAV